MISDVDTDIDSPIIKSEPTNEISNVDDSHHDSDASILNVESLRKRKRSQRIESESDSDDIPLSVLKDKLSSKPTDMAGTVKTISNGKKKPLKHKSKSDTKRKKLKRQFTTKPPPSQSSKPKVKRRNTKDEDHNDHESDDTDSVTDSHCNDTNDRSEDTDPTGPNSGIDNSDNDQSDSPAATTSKTTSPIVKSKANSATKNGNSSTTSASTRSDNTSKGKCKSNFYCTSKNCTVVKPTLKELNNHFRSSHDFAHCPECGKPFPTPSAVAKHMYQHRDDLLQCDQCEKAVPVRVTAYTTQDFSQRRRPIPSAQNVLKQLKINMI